MMKKKIIFEKNMISGILVNVRLESVGMRWYIVRILNYAFVAVH